MKSKSTLVLMEQLVMVLVFALAAALCIQAFSAADKISQKNAALDRAVLEAQNAAEAMKAGDEAYFAARRSGLNGSHGYCITYDGDWELVPMDSAEVRYLLLTAKNMESDYLWTGTVAVYDGETELYRLHTAGQREVTGDA